ncbi:unnamed protein product, partial [Ilex paraguariensis]
MNPLVDMMVTCLGEEVSGLAVAVAEAAALAGCPGTGFAPGQGATSTTLLAGWSVSNAMHQGTLVADLHIKSPWILHFL